jgi:hypothetical protein
MLTYNMTGKWAIDLNKEGQRDFSAHDQILYDMNIGIKQHSFLHLHREGGGIMSHMEPYSIRQMYGRREELLRFLTHRLSPLASLSLPPPPPRSPPVLRQGTP